MTPSSKPQIPINMVLETERCILRCPSHDDAGAMLTAFTSAEFPKELPTEAAQKVLEFGTEMLNATKFWAGSAEWNSSSERVLEKLGMAHISDNPEGYSIQGKPVPIKEFELTLP